VKLGDIVALIEGLVHERHGLDAALTLPHEVVDGGVLHRRTLHGEQARDHLEVVLHPVMNFFEEDLFLFERGLKPGVEGLQLGGALRHPVLQGRVGPH
jgi:hypothetical protein